MHLERLELVDFRSYSSARLNLAAGVRVLVGANAQGKTNLVEALHYLATGASHRVASDAPLVRAGAEAAIVRAVAHGDGRRFTVELELRPSGRNRARLNGQPQARVREALGQVRAVLVAPEDLALVRGDPGDRRRFLDDLLGQRRPAYLASRQEYERVVRQRTTLLRALRTPGRPPAQAETLATWTAALIRTGAALIAARIAVVHALTGPAAAAYRDLVVGAPPGAGAPSADRLRLDYVLSTGRHVPGEAGGGIPDPAALAAELAEGLEAVADAERDRGLTLAGPHRDDLFLGLGALPAKGYASHGEMWSLALALRLASREVLAEVGDEPIVMLDDVFAELDDHRRARLALRCAGFEQVLVTAAVDDDVPLAGPRHLVRGGTVSPDPVSAQEPRGGEAG